MKNMRGVRSILIFWLMAPFILLSSLGAASSTPPKRIRLVDPKEYVVKRFQEIVEDAESADDVDTQEKLIAARARLAVAEQSLENLKAPRSEGQDPVKAGTIRGAQAKVDHYRWEVADLEKQVLSEKKKEREKASPKKKAKGK